MKPMYKRVLLKLSGEALAGDKGSGEEEHQKVWIELRQTI